MTGQATLVGLHRSVLKHKGSHGVGVALCTDRELSCRSTNLMPRLCTVGIVAVAALNQSHLDPMSVRPGELGFLRSVASEAEVLLRFDQHEIYVGGFMRTVARCATEAVRHVHRFGEVLCFQTGLMALGADGRRLRGT